MQNWTHICESWGWIIKGGVFSKGLNEMQYEMHWLRPEYPWVFQAAVTDIFAGSAEGALQGLIVCYFNQQQACCHANHQMRWANFRQTQQKRRRDIIANLFCKQKVIFSCESSITFWLAPQLSLCMIQESFSLFWSVTNGYGGSPVCEQKAGCP